MMLLIVILLAMTAEDPSDFRNPRFVSPNGEMTVVIRRYPDVGDFERVPSAEYWAREPRATPSPAPQGALYRKLPSGNQELLAEFAFRSGEPWDVLVADDGHFVTHRPVPCGAKAEWLTIRAPDGSTVRTLLATDLMTRHDQHWLCRGEAADVRYAIDGETLRVTLVDTEDLPHTIDVDLATGMAPAPSRDHCRTALRVTVEAHDGPSQALLDRAIVRVMPDYPEVATKARIEGEVKVELVVGEDGKIDATKIHPLPFGIEQAVQEAIAKWEFAPHETRAAGSFVFRFAIERHLVLRTYR